MMHTEELISVEIGNKIYTLLTKQAKAQSVSPDCLVKGILSEWLLKNLRVETATVGLQTTRYLAN